MADGRVLRAERVRERRRKDILATSLRVFSEQGYWNTSITDLVRAAGVARAPYPSFFPIYSLPFLFLPHPTAAPLPSRWNTRPPHTPIIVV